MLTLNPVKSALLLLFSAVVVCAAPAIAPAQFMPFRPGFYWQNPATGQQFNYNFNANLAYNYSFMNPLTGAVYTNRFAYSYAGIPGLGYYPPVYGYPTYVSPYMSYGSYSSNSAENPFVRNQLRLLRNAPPQNQDNPAAGQANPGGDRAVPDLRNKPASATLPAGLNRALTEPADDAILSGKVLNELAAAIRGLERSGARADAPLLPAELVTHINYAGGPAADVLAVLQSGKPATPAALAGPEFAMTRSDLEQAVIPVIEPLQAGSRPDAATVDRLSTAVRRAKETLTPTLASLPRADADSVTKYLHNLEGLAKAAKDPSTTGILPRRWATVGASVSEVIRQMEKFKLTFAPVSAGDEDVYYSLHRGLVGYYAALAQAKK